MKKLLITASLFASVMSLAQEKQKTYEVQPYIAYLSDYKPYYKMAYTQIQLQNISLEEKQRLLNDEITKLKNKFRQERKAEFEGKLVELSVKNWCTSKSSGGKKNCGYKYVGAPIPPLYTTKSWTRVEGTNKGVTVAPDGSHAGLKMSVAGKGKNSGILFATFKYRPDYIAVKLDEDTNNLFNLVTE